MFLKQFYFSSKSGLDYALLQKVRAEIVAHDWDEKETGDVDEDEEEEEITISNSNNNSPPSRSSTRTHRSLLSSSANTQTIRAIILNEFGSISSLNA